MKLINMKKIVWIYGLVAGVIVSAIMAISMITCYNNPEVLGQGSMVIGYLSMLIAFSMIFVGVKNYRDKQNGGNVSFGKAFTIGLFIALIGSAMYVITWAIVYNFFVPDFMERYSNHMLQQAKKSGNVATMEQVATQMSQYKEMYKNPLFFVLITLVEILPVGIFVALLCALILKKKLRNEANTM